VSGASTKAYEVYYRVDIFTDLLWYHDKNKHVLYDSAHQFANVKQMLNTIKNRTKKDKLQFNTTIREVERKNGNCIHTHRMPYVVIVCFISTVCHTL
jgi:hypothetical protein